jgi:hypothetical protein
VSNVRPCLLDVLVPLFYPHVFFLLFSNRKKNCKIDWSGNYNTLLKLNSFLHYIEIEENCFLFHHSCAWTPVWRVRESMRNTSDICFQIFPTLAVNCPAVWVAFFSPPHVVHQRGVGSKRTEAFYQWHAVKSNILIIFNIPASLKSHDSLNDLKLTMAVQHRSQCLPNRWVGWLLDFCSGWDEKLLIKSLVGGSWRMAAGLEDAIKHFLSDICGHVKPPTQ